MGLFVLAGAVTGFVVGLTGVGGGAIMTPVLLFFFGVAPATAVGTDLWFAATTKSVASALHGPRGLIDWSIARRLWMGSLPASLGTVAFMRTRAVPLDPTLLTTAIAVAVLMTAFGLVFREQLHAFGRRFRVDDQTRFKAMQPTLTVAAGALLGILVTLTSIGAGALGTVFLTYLYPLRLTPSRLIATDIVHAIPLALFAGLGHLWVGNVDFLLLGLLLVGSVPGVIAGVKVSTRVPQQVLRWTLAAALLTVGVRLLWSTSL